MKTETRSLSSIKPYARNPRFNEGAIDAVAESIRQFGFRQPIVVDRDGVIIVGDTRYRAALRLGLTEAPVHVALDLSAEKVKAYRLADNKTGELAEWNDQLLKLELGDLEEASFDISTLGFSVDDLSKLFDPGVVDGLVDPDAAPPLPAVPTTKLGDLWLLGKHRLLCGSSSDSGDVARLMDGCQVELANTDPPYNVAVQPRSESKPRQQRAKDRPLLNDALPPAEYARRLNAWFLHLSLYLKPGRAFYIWGGYANYVNYPLPLRRAGLHFSQQIIWVKNQASMGRQDYNTKHEICFYGWREGAAHEYFGPTNAVDVWEMKRVPGVEMVHLTQKPIESAVTALQHGSRPGESVLDLFGGSGWTLIAAEQTDRRAFLMELDPLYCDVIVERWEKFTGKKAELAKGNEAKPKRRSACAT